jgi:hypothetical protein
VLPETPPVAVLPAVVPVLEPALPETPPVAVLPAVVPVLVPVLPETPADVAVLALPAVVPVLTPVLPEEVESSLPERLDESLLWLWPDALASPCEWPPALAPTLPFTLALPLPLALALPPAPAFPLA